MLLTGVSSCKWQEFQESLARILKVTVGIIEHQGNLAALYNGIPLLSQLDRYQELSAAYADFFGQIARPGGEALLSRIVFDPLGLPVAVIPVGQGNSVIMCGFTDKRDIDFRFVLNSRLKAYGVRNVWEIWDNLADISMDNLRSKMANVETLYCRMMLPDAVKEINNIMAGILSNGKFDLTCILDLVVNSLVFLNDAEGAWVFTCDYHCRSDGVFRGSCRELLENINLEWENAVVSHGDPVMAAASWVDITTRTNPGIVMETTSFKNGELAVSVGVINPGNGTAESSLAVFARQVVMAMEMALIYEAAGRQIGVILDSMRQAVVVTNRDGIILLANRASSDILSGLGTGSLINSHINCRGLGREIEVAVYNALCGKVYHRDDVVLGVEDNEIYLDWNVSPLLRDDGVIIGSILVFEDVTGLKEAENELRLSEERFSIAFNASPAIMAIIRCSDSTYIDVNQSFDLCVGFTREEVAGRAEPYIWLEQKEQGVLTQTLQEQGSYKNREIDFRTKSGETRTGLASVSTICLRGEKCYLCVMQDLTEEKRMKKEMDRLDRLNLVGQMAAGIGHEVRNPMTTVRGFLQLLMGKVECAAYWDYFDTMIEELDRANSIISEFLSVARNKTEDLKNSSINSIIKALTPLIKSDALHQKKEVVVEMEDVPTLLLNEKEIRQLVLNLARNGLEAMDSDGVLFIKTYNMPDEVVLSVKDQGKGIGGDILDKVGIPFFTTKENGTGLGLATCYSIAARHGATIDIDTGSRGTTVIVRFRPSI